MLPAVYDGYSAVADGAPQLYEQFENNICDGGYAPMQADGGFWHLVRGDVDKAFEELCDFVREAGFDYAGVFPYSQEEGTVAGDRADQVDPDERIDRANELRRICDQTGFAKTARHVGEEAWVLFEGHEHTDSGQEAVGRTMGQAPEIDGGVHVPDADLTPGTIARVRLVDSFCYEYEGECIR